MRERNPVLGRRDFVVLGVGAFVALALPFAWARPGLLRRQVPVMGTIAEFAVAAGGLPGERERAQRAIDAAIAELLDVERRMTRFEAGSDVSRANEGAARAPVEIGRDTGLVLREALRWARATDGRFDPALGRATALWDVARRKSPPPAALFTRLAGRDLYRAVSLAGDLDRPAVRFEDADVALDLGGIAKGYGVDRAAAALRSHGVENALINVGGDLVALGAAPGEDHWRVGVRSPQAPGALAGELAVRDIAVATSGDYEQFFAYGGRRYHHLLDPETGAPRLASFHSVTVEAPTCMAADAGATAVFGLPPAAAGRLLALAAPGARVASVV
ncbi:MAG: FAD:protein FMN transferase [Candidatus Sericytochromatia bacterium]|nr:FAD:protein FMN transferase [Candidatus Tanganyikabacteria bacterium]